MQSTFTTSTDTIACDAMGVSPARIHRFTVDEYHRLIEVGLLCEASRVELLEGLLTLKMTRKPPHDVAIDLASDAFRALVPPGWRIRIQSAITTTDSEPEPDLAIVRGSARDFIARQPGPADIGLMIEVADTTVAQDRALKGRIYARAALPCYWLINLVDRRVEVYTEPTAGETQPRYCVRHDFGPDDSITLILAGQQLGQVAVRELLP